MALLAGCRSQLDESYGIKTLDLTRFGGHVDFVAREQERTQDSKVGASKTESKETIFEESLGLETEGFILHPNIFEFGLAGVFGLVQEDFEDTVDGRERRASQNGDLWEFDLDAQLFKKRDTPVTVFAHRRRGLVSRPFLPSLETTTTAYGFTGQYVSETTPTSLQFTHTDARSDSLLTPGSTGEEGRQQNTELRFETAYRFSDQNVLSLTYRHESVKEEPFRLDYDADELTLSHQLEFGAEGRQRLRSEVNRLDQRGTVEIERSRWREDLWMTLSDTLESRVRFEALDRTYGTQSTDTPPVEERSVYLSGSLRHQLFESQTTQFLMFVNRQEFEPDLEITRWGGNVNVDYHRTNRWGILRANYGFRAERNDYRGTAHTNEIIDQTRTFRDPDPISLGHRNIDVGSITIRAEDRVTAYHRGRDYSVQTIGDRVEIWRMPTGRIADGETVLVNYIFSTGGTFKLDTIGHNFGIRQEFDFGLVPYYRFEWQDQSLTPVSATGAIAEDITAHLAGVEFRKESLRLFAEYEDHESNINPYSSTRTGASYTYRFKSGAETSIHGRWTDTRNRPPHERHITLLTVEGRHRHPLTRDLTLEGSVLYRKGEDSVSDDIEGVDIALLLEWLIRDTTISVRFEHSEFEDEHTRDDSSALFVHVRRSF